MVEPIHNQIIRILPTAKELYHRLVLVVGESGSGKTAVLSDVAQEYDTQVINLNLTLSKALLELTARQRVLRLPKLIAAIIMDGTSSIGIEKRIEGADQA